MISKESLDKMIDGGKKGGKKAGAKRITDGTLIMHTAPDLVISWEDAHQLGFTVYRTGKPCLYGHTGWRRLQNKQCVECQAEFQRKYPNNPRFSIVKTKKKR